METGLLKVSTNRGQEPAPPDRIAKPKRSRSHEPEIRVRSLGEGAAETPLGQNLITPEQQQRLRAIATLLDYKKSGEHIYSEGNSASFIYLIDEGIIRISRLTENGRRQILAFRGRGDLFGLPDGGHYANSAESVSAARVFRFSWTQLQELMLGDPQLQHMLFTKLANQVREAQKRILMLGQHNIHQRLASFILDFLDMPEFYDAGRAQLKLPVNRFDLADYLGTAPESTARAFARLESEGLVKRVGMRLVEIRNLDGLHALQNERRRAPR